MPTNHIFLNKIKKISLLMSVLICSFFNNTKAMSTTFEPGTLIIPMDTDYQDDGIFKAYGLVYQLLLNNITVLWAIREDKVIEESDFTASATDHLTGSEINNHEYRGGPFIISADSSSEALQIIVDWLSEHDVAVHQATMTFDAPIITYLVAAPTIAVFADGSEDVAFDYMNAAGIPDSLGQPWPDEKDRTLQYDGYPDILNFDEVVGEDYDNDRDGALFDDNENPTYCQIMTMHWRIWDEEDEEADRNDGVVKEIRAFLDFPVHLMAECQAVNAIENSQYGHFLSPNGFIIGEQPEHVEFFNSDTPFGQMDGAFETVGGSEPAFSLPEGDTYFDAGSVLITEAGTPIGTNDIWMTGYKDGDCIISDTNEECQNPTGKISYLAGHRYKTDLPISENPDSQGTRLFLNSLFDAQCATLSGQPTVALTKSATQVSTSGQVTFELTYQNLGPGVITDVTVSDTLPEGMIFVSSSSEEVQESDGRVFIEETSLGEWDERTLSIAVELQDFGRYENTASITYNVGMNQRILNSNTTTTFYNQNSDRDRDGIPDQVEQEGCTSPDLPDTDEDGFSDSEDICPCHHNPLQELTLDPLNCGECGNICLFAQAIPECILSNCEMAGCESGFSNCDRITANGCEYDNTLFNFDPSNCGGCLQECTFPNADSGCLDGSCLLGPCHEGYHNNDGVPENGCEATCNPVPIPETSCNGIDDDCDGQIDEDFTGELCILEGCLGQTVCVDGEEECETTENQEGADTPGSCSDQLDNDCDGMIDQDDPECSECEEDSSCEDGLYCTVNDICFRGQCRAVFERSCETGNPCLIGSCNETTRSCEYTTIPDCLDDIFEEPEDTGEINYDISEPAPDEAENNITTPPSECGCRTLTTTPIPLPKQFIFFISILAIIFHRRLGCS